MKRKFLITTVALATLTLAACHRPTNRADYINDAPNTSRGDYGNEYGNESESNNGNDFGMNDNRMNDDDNTTMDPHYDFVNELGFSNITNPTGDSYYRRYRLDSNNAAEDDIFHGWRHAWVDPNDYRDEDIDVYRYTGDYDGERRTIHIMSHRGTPIGGYHFGEGETAEDARMIDHDGYISRVADDFREAWDDMFDIKR